MKDSTPISAFEAYSKSKRNSPKGKAIKKKLFDNKTVAPSYKLRNKVKKHKNDIKQEKRIKTVSKTIFKSAKGNMKGKTVSQMAKNGNGIIYQKQKSIPNLNGGQNKKMNEISTGTVKKNKNETKTKTKQKKIKVKNHQFDIDTGEVKTTENRDIYQDSTEKGKALFSSIISPVPVDKFFKDVWEHKPIHIKRNKPEYFSHLFSMKEMDAMFRNNSLFFGKNVDITLYGPNGRETFNPEGRVHSAIVWDYYSNGCSVRLLNPQTYVPKLQSVMSFLQEYFQCLVGANAYLTPPNSQGFAPHYDDIEAFILQIEGTKHWKLYKPRTESEVLPRFSSGNFKETDLPDNPIMEVILTAGDVLYFPRGTIHQGRTLPDQHSLHITLSVYQKNSWGDFLEKMLPIALKEVIKSDIEFRKGLPLNYLSHIGTAHSNQNDDAVRSNFKDKVVSLMSKLVNMTSVDSAADQMAKKFVEDALPPVLNEDEVKCSVFGDGDRVGNNGEIVNKVEISSSTRIRLLRKNILRLVKEVNAANGNEELLVYHYVDNSKEYHGMEESQYLEIEGWMSSKIEHLIDSYPDYISINDLLDDSNNDLKTVQLMSDFWERGLLLTEGPLSKLK